MTCVHNYMDAHHILWINLLATLTRVMMGDYHLWECMCVFDGSEVLMGND